MGNVPSVPPFGLFTTVSCGAHVQVREPQSLAVRPPSAVAVAPGTIGGPGCPLGCDMHAVIGVVAGVNTVTMTAAPGASVPRLHCSTLAGLIVQVPCPIGLTVTDVQVR